MRVIGACVLLCSVSILGFAGMAYVELHNAATSETAPSVDSMPLTRIVGPELFDTGSTGIPPSAMARTTFHRIYAIGAGGVLLGVFAVLILARPQSPRTEQNES